LLYVFSSLMKGRLDPDFVLFCAFSGKSVIQKTKKKIFFFNHICGIITFIYLSKSIIKSCINKPVEHFDPVLSLNFELPVSEIEEEKDGTAPNEISRLLGHFSCRICKQNIKKIVQKRTFNYKDWQGMLAIALQGYCTSVHASTGATPPTSLSI